MKWWAPLEIRLCAFCIRILTDKIGTLSILPAVLWHKLCIVSCLPPQNMNYRSVQDLKHFETKICLASQLSWGLRFGILLKGTLTLLWNFSCVGSYYQLENNLVKWILFKKIRQLSENQISKQFWHAGESSAFCSIVFTQNGHVPHKNQIVSFSLGESDFSLFKHINLWIFPIPQKPLCTAVQLEP